MLFKTIEKHHLVFSVFLTMRELHRPIHDSFIFARDWLHMSDEAKEKAKKQGKIRLIFELVVFF